MVLWQGKVSLDSREIFKTGSDAESNVDLPLGRNNHTINYKRWSVNVNQKFTEGKNENQARRSKWAPSRNTSTCWNIRLSSATGLQSMQVQWYSFRWLEDKQNEEEAELQNGAQTHICRFDGQTSTGWDYFRSPGWNQHKNCLGQR
jgi:hypothetical protein